MATGRALATSFERVRRNFLQMQRESAVCGGCARGVIGAGAEIARQRKASLVGECSQRQTRRIGFGMSAMMKASVMASARKNEHTLALRNSCLR